MYPNCSGKRVTTVDEERDRDRVRDEGGDGDEDKDKGGVPIRSLLSIQVEAFVAMCHLETVVSAKESTFPVYDRPSVMLHGDVRVSGEYVSKLFFLHPQIFLYVICFVLRSPFLNFTDCCF